MNAGADTSRRLRTGHLRECETARRELRRGRPRRVDVVISLNTYKVSHRLHPPARISTAERTRRSKVWRRFRASLVSTRRLWSSVVVFLPPFVVSRGALRRVGRVTRQYPPRGLHLRGHLAVKVVVEPVGRGASARSRGEVRGSLCFALPKYLERCSAQDEAGGSDARTRRENGHARHREEQHGEPEA